ncbi:MAG: hypothetical protein J0L55_04645 [Caulobacterales bacterium]|nr:hypothetical protein [Caulobacterales bacterium]MCA0371487.1 cupin domain-containing protein [Pseudomonadota bacterium]
MGGLAIDIARQTLENNNFRKILFKGQNLRIEIMTLEKGQEVCLEANSIFDKFLRFELGEGIVKIGAIEIYVEEGSGVLIPKNNSYIVNNIGNMALKFSKIYTRPDLNVVN